ncbi:hypothetical protein EGW08_023270 [Elysia chlorotica]|uniref:Uncharacterized protein n=1 Tax=Elysia chlorotica TaxID=188477 RepID=A0A433SJ03_ELYCH|nr:hypothetical protein EGW08_023270 [Elysia chlorotica]
MSPTLLKLCFLAGVLAVVLASPLERERRASKFNRLVKKVTGKIKDAFSWMSPSYYGDADTVEEDAEKVLVGVKKAISQGHELLLEGEKLHRQADALGASGGIDKRDFNDFKNGLNSMVQAVRDAAERTIEVGNKIINNSEKISNALGSAVANISEVLREGVADVGSAVVDFTVTVVKGANILDMAITTVENIDQGVTDVLDELSTATGLVLDASQNFQDISSRSLTLYQKAVKFGKQLVDVVKKAAKAVYKAAGFSGRK